MSNFIKKISNHLCKKQNKLSKCCDSCECCGTGNQCWWWEYVDGFAGNLPGMAPHKDRLNGFTNIGRAFDVIVNCDMDDQLGVSYALNITQGSLSGLLRFRLGPLEASPEELERLFGPATNTQGRWQRCSEMGWWPLAGGSSQNTDVSFKWEVDPNRPFACNLSLAQRCERWYIDTGRWSASWYFFADDAGDIVQNESGSVTNAGIEQIPYFMPWWPAFAVREAFGAANPFRFIQQTGQCEFSGTPLCNGVVWFQCTPTALPLDPTSLVSFDPADPCRESFRPPWQDLPGSDDFPGFLYWVNLLRQGGSWSASCNGSSHTMTYEVSHGEHQFSKLRETTRPNPSSVIGNVYSIRNYTQSYMLVRLSSCPGSENWLANDCTPANFDTKIGRRCDDPTQIIFYNPDDRPTPFDEWPTFLYTDTSGNQYRYYFTDEISDQPAAEIIPSRLSCPDIRIALNCRDNTQTIAYDNKSRPTSEPYRTVIYDGERYIPTDTKTTTQDPVTVQWSLDECPTGDYAFADICDPDRVSSLFPARIIYKVNPAVGAGNGVVFKQITTPNPDCPDEFPVVGCTARVYYRPTTDVAQPPQSFGVYHNPSTAPPCFYKGFSVCNDCQNLDDTDRPIITPFNSFNINPPPPTDDISNPASRPNALRRPSNKVSKNPFNGIDAPFDDQVGLGAGAVIFRPIADPFEVKKDQLGKYVIPEDFDPEQEIRRMRSGGCCGQSSL